HLHSFPTRRSSDLSENDYGTRRNPNWCRYCFEWWAFLYMVIKKKFLLVWRRNVMQLNVDDVSFGIREKQIISNINLHAKSGEIVGIIGPNGSGTSTLLKNIYRVNKPDAGKISLTYRDIHSLTAVSVSNTFL